MGWAQEIRYLLRLQRRNPKLFFRRVKHSSLMSMRQPEPPMDTSVLSKLMSSPNPHDPSILHMYKAMEAEPAPFQLPTDEELRRMSRVPRTKRAGPDGIHPYLIYQLPDQQFHVIACCIRSILMGWDGPRSLWDAHVVGLFKGKPNWEEASAWRPISMPTAMYRLLMRWVVRQLQPFLESYIDRRQYGRRGASTAMATLELLSWQRRMEETTGCFGALLDVQNAFSSVPHELLFQLLERVGIPEYHRRLVVASMSQGWMIPVGEGCPFKPTAGVRQGCPLSVLLFTLFYDLLLQLCGLPCSAFVDDLAVLAPSKEALLEEVVHLQGIMTRMGLRLNLGKCVFLGPPDESWDEVAFYPSLHGGGAKMQLSTHGVHLGHPICFPQSAAQLTRMVAEESHKHMQHFLNTPLPLSARVTVLNHILIPRMLYQLECIPPDENFLKCVLKWTGDLILGLSDIPNFTNTKTLFSPARFGLGCAYFPTLLPQRCLDVCHKFLRYKGMDVNSFPGLSFVLECLRGAARCLGAEVNLGAFPMRGSSCAPSSEHPLQGCPCIEMPPMVERGAPLPGLFSDGSFDPGKGQCASAVVLPDGSCKVLRPHGPPSSYKAEVYALCLAVDCASQGDTIFTDSAAALAAISGVSERVVLGAQIQAIREGVAFKDLTVQHVPGHQGIEGNEMADQCAQWAQTVLPPPRALHPQAPWDICFGGELCQPPHKTWAKSNTPTHHPYDIHPVSWRYLKVGWWFKWLCGLVSAVGFDHPQSFWHNTPASTPCLYCGQLHNRSVHGFIGMCESTAMPLVKAWLEAWGPLKGLLTTWRQGACARDRFLLGKLVIPWNLWLHLKEKVGDKGTKKAVRHFQQHVLHRLKPHVPRFHIQRGHPRRRLNPWHEEDWLPTPRRRPSAHFPPQSGRPGRSSAEGSLLPDSAG